MPPPVRRVLLLAPPLLLAVLEVLHPNPEVDRTGRHRRGDLVRRLPRPPARAGRPVILSVILLADDFGHAGAWSTRLGLGVFLVFFSAYDAVAGIGTGLAMRSARDLSPAQQEGVFEVVKDWPGVSPVFWLSIVGTPGWLVAVGGLALAARRLGAPRSEWVLLALAAFFLMLGHPFPGGTLAFGCLFAAGLIHERRSGRDTAADPGDPALHDG